MDTPSPGRGLVQYALQAVDAQVIQHRKPPEANRLSEFVAHCPGGRVASVSGRIALDFVTQKWLFLNHAEDLADHRARSRDPDKDARRQCHSRDRAAVDSTPAMVRPRRYIVERILACGPKPNPELLALGTG